MGRSEAIHFRTSPPSGVGGRSQRDTVKRIHDGTRILAAHGFERKTTR